MSAKKGKPAKKKNKRQHAIIGLIHANPHTTQAQSYLHSICTSGKLVLTYTCWQ